MNSRTLRILFATVTVSLSTALYGLLAGCSGGKKTLHIYNWADYISPDVIRAFENEHSCRIVYDVYDSNEAMYAKLLSGARGYDIVFPSSYQAILMQKQGMLEKLDHEKLPALAHLDSAFMQNVALDKGAEYSIPYLVGTTGLAYNKERIGEAPSSWAALGNPTLKGRTTLLDDYREALGIALLYLGHSANSDNQAQVEAAGELLLEWKRNCARMSAMEYIPGLASGEFHLSHGYSSSVGAMMSDGAGHVDFVLPKEGFTIWVDSVAILAKAPEKELAYAFLDFLCQPKNSALNMEYNRGAAPNPDAVALLPEELRADPVLFPDEDTLTRGEQLFPIEEHTDKIYLDVWMRVKARQ